VRSSLERYSTDLLATSHGLRLLPGDVPEQGMEGGKPSVAGPCCVAPGRFQIVQKGHNQLVLESFYCQLVHWLFKQNGSEVQEQFDAVSVSANGVGA